MSDEESSLRLGCANAPPRQIVAIGQDAVAAARFYAERTGGTMLRAEQPDDIPRDGASTIVVSPPERLTVEWLDPLAGVEDGGQVSGFLCAPVRDLDAAARSWVKRFVNGPRHRNDARFEFFSEALSAGGAGMPNQGPLRILDMRGHSDGIALSLGSSYVCAVPRLGSAKRAPPCSVTRRCARLENRDFNELIEAERLIDPANFDCDVLVLTSCHGWLFPDHIFDQRFGLGAAFAGTPRVTATIVTPGLFVEGTIAGSTDLLIANLQAGKTLGAAVAAANAVEPLRTTGQYHVLFGDPDWRVAEETRVAGTHPAPCRLVCGSLPERGSDLDLVEAVVAFCYPEASMVEYADLEALCRLTTLLGGLSRDELGLVPPTNSSTVGALMEAILDFLVRLRRFGFFWLPLASTIEGSRGTFRDGSAAQILIGRLSEAQLPARAIHLGLDGVRFRDAPIGCSFEIDFKDGALELAGDLPREAWAGTIVVWWGRILPDSRVPWPAEPDGACARRCVIAPPGTPGIYHIHVSFVIGWRVIVLGVRVAL